MSAAQYPNPFPGEIKRAILPKVDQFLMFYYLPTGEQAGSATTTGPTYYTTWKSNDIVNVSAAWGALNYTTRTNGRPYALTYEAANNGFKFGGNTIINYALTNSTFSSDAYSLKEKTLDGAPGKTSWSIDSVTSQADIFNGDTFQLKQVNTNVPENEIYAGVWYTMKNNGNEVVPPVFDLPPNVGNDPFPNNTSTVQAYSGGFLNDPWVMFIPYTTNMSYWVGGQCQVAGWNTGMLLVNDWILTHFNKNHSSTFKPSFPQTHCYGNLGIYSKYCAYMGTTCNGGLGFNYAGINGQCGKYFGKCMGDREGLNCTWDSAGGSNTFYCSPAAGTGTNVDPSASSNPDVANGRNTTPETSNWVMTIIVIIFATLLLLFVIFYMVGHYHEHHDAPHSGINSSSHDLYAGLSLGLGGDS